MVILMIAAAILGAFLGRFLKASSLIPVCFLILALALAETRSSLLEAAARGLALIVILQLGYVFGLASTDVAVMLTLRREPAPGHQQRYRSLLSRLHARQRGVIARNAVRDDSNAGPVEAASSFHTDKRR